ncbi:MAG: DUF4446 family protein [Eubacterium sp.]|nr:DUF4446 family protein [Eubacterium sp.]
MDAIFGSSAAGVIIIALVVVVVILAMVMVNMNLRMSRMLRRYKLFMKGTDGQSVEKAMAERLREIGKLRISQKQAEQDMSLMQGRVDRMLCKYGIVKYDAFEDVGGKMSFALAMLDRNNTGFVLNAIHSRDNCYLYLKDIVNGASYIILSDEEIEALQRAAHSDEESGMDEGRARKRRAAKADSEKSGRKRRSEEAETEEEKNESRSAELEEEYRRMTRRSGSGEEASPAEERKRYETEEEEAESRQSSGTEEDGSEGRRRSGTEEDDSGRRRRAGTGRENAGREGRRRRRDADARLPETEAEMTALKERVPAERRTE